MPSLAERAIRRPESMMPAGFRSGLVQDASRTDWDGAGPRPISWAAWYPATDNATTAPMRVGGPAEPWFDIGAVARDAPLSERPAKCPVVLASHGTGGTAVSLGWLGRRLAEHGIVMLAVNHHGNTAVEPCRPEGFLCWWERARDLTILLEHVAADGPLAGRLALDHVAAVGFSLGCHTALSLLGAITDMKRFRDWAEVTGGPLARGPREFPDLADQLPQLVATRAPFRASWERRAISYRDPRVKAALLLAPAPPVRAFTDESLAATAVPVSMMVGGADSEAPAQDGAEWLLERLPQALFEQLGPAVGHYVFLPEATEAGRSAAPVFCVDAQGADRRAVHDAAFAAALRLIDVNA